MERQPLQREEVQRTEGDSGAAVRSVHLVVRRIRNGQQEIFGCDFARLRVRLPHHGGDAVRLHAADMDREPLGGDAAGGGIGGGGGRGDVQDAVQRVVPLRPRQAPLAGELADGKGGI